MLIFLYLAVLITALYWVAKILLPEMTKPNSFDFSQSNDPDKRIEKLEILLAEKNKNISLLQTELKIFHAQVRSFDKMKTLLDEEIHHLKEQNRIFRSELGIPPIVLSVEPKENSIT